VTVHPVNRAPRINSRRPTMGFVTDFMDQRVNTVNSPLCKGAWRETDGAAATEKCAARVDGKRRNGRSNHRKRCKRIERYAKVCARRPFISFVFSHGDAKTRRSLFIARLSLDHPILLLSLRASASPWPIKCWLRLCSWAKPPFRIVRISW
jgi:hypothetical protein